MTIPLEINCITNKEVHCDAIIASSSPSSPNWNLHAQVMQVPDTTANEHMYVHATPFQWGQGLWGYHRLVSCPDPHNPACRPKRGSGNSQAFFCWVSMFEKWASQSGCQFGICHVTSRQLHDVDWVLDQNCRTKSQDTLKLGHLGTPYWQSGHYPRHQIGLCTFWAPKWGHPSNHIKHLPPAPKVLRLSHYSMVSWVQHCNSIIR